MTDIQQRVQEAIDELVESGAERGLQVAVYHQGEQVVDPTAGVADPTTGRPLTSDTPFFSYSIGKGMASTVIHVLAERGVLDYDTRIVELWPEFGAHGKETATVRHVLSQSVTFVAEPGDVVVVAPGVLHSFANAGEEEARLRIEVRPALAMERMFAEIVRLAEAGRMGRRGLPRNPFDLARLARAYDQEAHAPLLSVPVQRAMLAPLIFSANRPRLSRAMAAAFALIGVVA